MNINTVTQTTDVCFSKDQILQHLETLQQVFQSTSPTRNDELDYKVAEILDLARDFLRADICGVLLANPNLDQLLPILGLNVPESLLDQWRGHMQSLPFDERLKSLNEEIYWSVGQALSSFTQSEVDNLNAQNYLRMPLYLKDQVFGLLILASHQHIEWSAAQLRAAATLASMVETLIEKLTLEHQGANQAFLHESMYDLARLMNQDVDLDNTLNQILGQVVRLTAASGAKVMLLEDDHLKLMAEIGPEGVYQLTSARLGEGLMGQVALLRESILVRDYSSYDQAVTEVKERVNLTCGLAVPLLSKEQLIGVLALYQVAEDEYPPLTERDQALLEALAPLAAMAIENAQLRDAVRQERSHLHAILDHISAPLMLFDAKGHLTLANPAAHNIGRRLGLSLYSYIGYHIGDIIALRPNQIGQLPKPFPVGTPVDLDLGEAGQFVCRMAEMPSISDQGGGYVVVGQEVTQERRLSQARSELLHLLSHDLGNKLSLALGYASLLVDEPIDDDEQPLFLRRIFDSLNEARALIRDVLDIEDAEVRGVQIAKDYNIAELLTKITDVLESAAAFKEQTLIYEIRRAPHTTLIGNVRLIQQALDNLINNAIKYTPKGGQVRVTLDADQQNAMVIIEDTGIGIATEELPKIWGQFYRVNTPETREISGSGLGLALVRSVIEGHQGYIEAESQVGIGSTFRVTLPLNMKLPTSEDLE